MVVGYSWRYRQTYEVMNAAGQNSLPVGLDVRTRNETPTVKSNESITTTAVPKKGPLRKPPASQ